MLLYLYSSIRRSRKKKGCLQGLCFEAVPCLVEQTILHFTGRLHILNTPFKGFFFFKQLMPVFRGNVAHGIIVHLGKEIALLCT